MVWLRLRRCEGQCAHRPPHSHWRTAVRRRGDSKEPGDAAASPEGEAAAGSDTIHRLGIHGDLERDGLGEFAAGSGDDHTGGGGRCAAAAAAAVKLRDCDYAGDQHQGQEKCTPLLPSEEEAGSDRERGSLGKERVGTALESGAATLG